MWSREYLAIKRTRFTCCFRKIYRPPRVLHKCHSTEVTCKCQPTPRTIFDFWWRLAPQLPAWNPDQVSVFRGRCAGWVFGTALLDEAVSGILVEEFCVMSRPECGKGREVMIRLMCISLHRDIKVVTCKSKNLADHSNLTSGTQSARQPSFLSSSSKWDNVTLVRWQHHFCYFLKRGSWFDSNWTCSDSERTMSDSSRQTFG